jgi:hypothetical protein
MFSGGLFELARKNLFNLIIMQSFALRLISFIKIKATTLTKKQQKESHAFPPLFFSNNRSSAFYL